jgi:hypothetical protein
MLLTEAFDISDNTLCETFGLSVPVGGTSLSDLRIPHSAQGFEHSETLKTTYEADEGKGDSGRLAKVGKPLLFFLSHDTDKSWKVPDHSLF